MSPAMTTVLLDKIAETRSSINIIKSQIEKEEIDAQLSKSILEKSSKLSSSQST